MQVEPQKAREYGVKVKDQELNYRLEKEGMKAEAQREKEREDVKKPGSEEQLKKGQDRMENLVRQWGVQIILSVRNSIN